MRIIIGVVLNLFWTKTGCDWNTICFCPNARLYAHHICHVVLWMDCNQVFVVFLFCLLLDHRICLLWDDDGRPYRQWTTRNHCCNFLLFSLQPLCRVHDSTTGRYLATNPWSRGFLFILFFKLIFAIFWPQKYFKFSKKINSIHNSKKQKLKIKNPPNFPQFFCQKSDENFALPMIQFTCTKLITCYVVLFTELCNFAG